MYTYQSLEKTPNQVITECFNRAFSDYALPMRLSEEILQFIFQKSCVDKKYSYGAFCQGEMVGFIFHSHSVWNGKESVFDAGTGIVPEHRGKKVFSRLFEYAENELKQAGYQKYFLEVLQENKTAIAAYQKKGFSVTREFSVFRSPKELLDFHSEQVKTATLSDFLKLDCSACSGPTPCYEHHPGILAANPELYQAAYLEENGKLSAFCIYTSKNGGIVQMGNCNREDLEVVIKYLMSRFSGFPIKNVDRDAEDYLSLLESLGFEEVTRQYEMAKDLSAK